MMFSNPWRSPFTVLALASPLAIAAVFSTLAPAIAQISIFPVVLELTADEMGESQALIEVSNPTDETFQASITPKPFSYHRTRGFITTNNSQADLSPYLQFYPAELNLPPGTSRTIRIVTAFPEGLPPQEYRVALITEELNPKLRTTNNQRSRNNRVAITIYARNGQVEPYLQVTGAQWNQFGRSVELIVENVGQASARPVVNWGVYRGEQELMVGSTPPMAVITGTERNLSLNDPRLGNLSQGYYQIKGNLVFDTAGKPLVQPFNEIIKIP